MSHQKPARPWATHVVAAAAATRVVVVDDAHVARMQLPIMRVVALNSVMVRGGAKVPSGERLRPEENNGRKTRRDEVGGTGAGGLLVGRGAHHELQRAISLRHGKYCDVIAGTRSIVARLPSVGGIEEHPVGADHQRRGPAVRPAAVHPTRRVGSVPAPRA
jgi:hypothetical protein